MFYLLVDISKGILNKITKYLITKDILTKIYQMTNFILNFLFLSFFSFNFLFSYQQIIFLNLFLIFFNMDDIPMVDDGEKIY